MILNHGLNRVPTDLDKYRHQRDGKFQRHEPYYLVLNDMGAFPSKYSNYNAIKDERETRQDTKSGPGSKVQETAPRPAQS